ncbi:tocopherol cyclase family protein [Thermosynechococcaceae cyanobacterium BACA0444]|uniref:Tocopherol cyclase family protein n=1 Tax=Pseudocalidococcus azoricus BACA0444 TaxID=2918990 RepID=A0AAE4JW86_9CYAN|nr:tocopherol cyclase family protein [Pseudocalidococcus azoricus]MDS3859873.1 tocopherol cyclase family protein [Pseudocalidococcus azoricus BACA0444]
MNSIPHGGYHWDGFHQPFFEGWYYRITLPDPASFAFMYSIQQPGGGATQVYGPGESYFCRSFPHVTTFWAWSDAWGLGHTDTVNFRTLLNPSQFFRQVNQGYQATDRLNQGQLKHPNGEVIARWHYEIKPIQTWGHQQATAGWLSYLPLYDPGWQVLLAHGLASGWIQWQGKTYEFDQAPAYAEKNWGQSFPTQWFWIQANAFGNHPDLSLTAAGGVRQILAWEEPAGLIGIHFQNQFYEFAPWTEAQLAWEVTPWGSWSMTGISKTYRAEITAHCPHPPAKILVPTAQGMIPACWDTLQGFLILRLYDRDTLIFQATTKQAGLEVGGVPWPTTWSHFHSKAMTEGAALDH